ncbi:hypothetical protein KM043_007468 [Ampulex compressa]|nr:hypothetical protein KM043_007468 [Ampulex compressa]
MIGYCEKAVTAAAYAISLHALQRSGVSAVSTKAEKARESARRPKGAATPKRTDVCLPHQLFLDLLSERLSREIGLRF